MQCGWFGPYGNRTTHPGFEPGDPGTKILCLSVWRMRIISYGRGARYSPRSICIYSFVKQYVALDWSPHPLCRMQSAMAQAGFEPDFFIYTNS